MKKILATIAVVMLSATSMMAQNPDKGLSFAVETGIGTEWEIGARGQYNFSKHFAWDVLSLKYARDFDEFNEITLETGLRAFSPEFGPNLKAFAALDLGYGNAFANGGSSSHFALDFTLGVYVYKGFYVGYGLGYLSGDIGHTDHVLRIGYNFTF